MKLPDLSSWDLSNVNKINSMLSGCSNLEYLPEFQNGILKKLLI